jgi:tetratricopeptide (TPR) repeat protein
VLSERRHLALLRAELVPLETAGPLPDSARALSVIAEKIRSFGGQVQELSAMTIVGAFGLEPIENAPNSAAFAALAIQKAAERARRIDSRVPGVKIAVHAAQLMVRRVNGIAQIDLEEKHATQTALATLSEVAQAHSTLVSATAAPFLERRFELSRDHSVEGGGGPHYRLTRLERTGFGLGGPTLAPFVGRQRELSVVEDQLVQAERSRGQIVAVVGEPGVGKSRFVYELTLTDRIRTWKVLSCRAFSYGVSTPSLPVVELLKGYFHIDDRETPSQIREKVSKKILLGDSRLESHLPALFALLDVLVEDSLWHALDPPQRRQRTIGAVNHVLLRESQALPLLVIFEDLHWIDTETQGLLDSLAESLPAERVLLLVTYRPEYQHRWGSKTYYTQLRLDSLPAESTAELLGALLGPDPGLAPLKQMLVKRGNPFFLEETLRTLVETGALAGARAALRLTRPVEALQIPATVEAILAARIDRLPAEEKQLLQTASVIGKDIPHSILKAIVEQPEEILRQRLAHLQKAEFLYETHLFPDLKHTFKHALTHEVTYGSLLQDRRRQLHAQIVAAIERLYADRLSEHVERLAHHALRGHRWDTAVRYSRQAGTRALDRSAAREALAAFEQARIALKELPESRERTEQLIDLCFEQRSALVPLGEFTRLGEVLDEGRALAQRLNDQRRLGSALAYQAGLQSFLGEPARAIEAGERACAIAEAVSDLGLRVVANYYLGQALWWSGDPRGAAEPLRTVIALVKSAPLGERFGLTGLPPVVARWHLAAVLAELGEFPQAIAAGEEGLRIAQAAGHTYSEVWARDGLGYAHLRHGDFAQATRVLEPGLALCRAMEIRVVLPFAAGSLGSAYLWSGRAADAVPLLEEAVEAFTAMRVILSVRSLSIASLAEAYLVLGRVADAREQAEQAVALARARQQRGWAAWALKMLGDIHAHGAAEPEEAVIDQGEVEQAEEAYRRALTLATELGMRPLVAHCHLGLGKLYGRTSKREQTRQHFTLASTMYREMDMQFWREQAAAALNEVRVL